MYMKKKNNSKHLLTLQIVTLVSSVLIVGTAITYAGFAKSVEIKDGDSNLHVQMSPFSASIKVQLFNSALTNSGEGQDVYIIFFDSTEGLSSSASKVRWSCLYCGSTWDNVTMDYIVVGIGELDKAVVARYKPGSVMDLDDVATAVNTTGATMGTNLWTVTNAETISPNMNDDVYRVYWKNDESNSNYYHLEFNPVGTPNNP